MIMSEIGEVRFMFQAMLCSTVSTLEFLHSNGFSLRRVAPMDIFLSQRSATDNSNRIDQSDSSSTEKELSWSVKLDFSKFFVHRILDESPHGNHSTDSTQAPSSGMMSESRDFRNVGLLGLSLIFHRDTFELDEEELQRLLELFYHDDVDRNHKNIE